jgi:hypothetical protein
MGARNRTFPDDTDTRLHRSSPGAARRWISTSIALSRLTAVAAVAVVIWLVCSVQMIAGMPRMVGPGPSHHDKNFPTVNAVSGVPSEWIAAVCKPHTPYPGLALFATDVMFLYPNTTFGLRRATYSAVCPARYEAASDPVVVIAEYPAEDPMQLDLDDNGLRWYCFAADHGHLFVLATRAEEQGAGTPNGFGDTPVLAPLEADGFDVYRNSGP